MPIGDLLAQITGQPSPTQTTTPLPLSSKRKISTTEPLQRKESKISTPASNFCRPGEGGSKPRAVDNSIAKTKLGTNVGTLSAMSPTASSAFKNGHPTPPPADVAAKPPKKGSFAEVMARAKAAQATAGQVGKIQHKRIEKAPSKREREEMKAQKSTRIQKNVGPNGKFRNSPGATAIYGKKTRVGGKAEEPVPEKKIKKSALATTGYSGTARPKPGSAKPSSKSSASAMSRHGDRDRYRDDRGSSKHYTYASEEEDEEDEEDYASDVSSDMEAAAFEVDEEEELAARIARKEDAEALAEENQMKREKAEKKRRLMEMARKRR